MILSLCSKGRNFCEHRLCSKEANNTPTIIHLEIKKAINKVIKNDTILLMLKSILKQIELGIEYVRY